MTEELIDSLEIGSPRKRPVFLTVLCILTWIGSGIGLVVFSFQIVKYARLAKPGSYYLPWGQLIEYYTWYFRANIAGLLGCIVCIVAAWMMWKLRQRGFYLYVVGQVIPMIVLFIAQVQGQHLIGETLIFAFLKMIFPVGFIVMYALNLKYLRSHRTENLQ